MILVSSDQWACSPMPARCKRRTSSTRPMIPRSTYRPHGATCRVVAGRDAAVSSFCLRSPYEVMPQGLYTESVVVTSKTNKAAQSSPTS
jgi:hypothetical protein